MRHTSTIGVPNVYIEGSYRGHKVSPGIYTIGLKSGIAEVNTECSILPNPTYPISADEYKEYDEYMLKMENALIDMHQKVNTIFDMKKLLEEVLKNSDVKIDTALIKKGKQLVTKMKNWDELMVQRKSKAYDDVENYPNKFTAEFIFLINQTESGLPRITDPSRERLKDLSKQWNELNVTAKEIIETDIPEFNKQLWDAGIGAVRIRKIKK
jgi:hypothetical protein